MGYETYVTGELEVKPPLPAWELETSGFDEGGELDLIHAGTEGEPETVGILPDGSLGVIGGSDLYDRFTPRYEEPYKAYHLDEHVRLLIQLAEKHGSKVNGCLYLDGEESHDYTRIRVEDSTFIHESPILVWPNGDETTLGGA